MTEPLECAHSFLFEACGIGVLKKVTTLGHSHFCVLSVMFQEGHFTEQHLESSWLREGAPLGLQ